jgi:kumamolisin
VKQRCAALALVAALASPAAASAVPLRLVLPLRTDTRALTHFADTVNTPGSPDYGDYASITWLARHFGATAAVRHRVLGYLRAHGASSVSVAAAGQLVEARISSTAAARLFHTTLTPRRGAHDTSYIAPDSAARVPRALRRLVTGVIGLNTRRLDDDALPASSGYQGPDPGATPSGCAAGTAQGGFTPNEYLDAYQYAPLQQQGLLGQGERVALIEIDGFQMSDLETFANCFGLHLPTIRTFPIGDAGRLPAGGEATLDLELLDAAAPSLKSIDVYETQSEAAAVLAGLATPLQSTGFKPQVISVSLGLCESETRQSVGQSGINALETVLKVASAAGVSVLGAGGDSGSAACPNSGSTTAPPEPLPNLAVTFPASSPWVTAVGGTNFDLTAQNQLSSQVVWNDADEIPGSAAGGGVSELFTRPSWQDGVVSSRWRAEPDVAMLADVSPGYAVYCTAQEECDGRGWISFGGTSAATPLLAGGFAVVDEALRREGHIALGLANPLLYRLGRDTTTAAQVFYDVTNGSNDVGPFIQSSQQPLGCCSAGPGYDEASGWGGLNLQAFEQAALGVQRKLASVAIAVTTPQTPVASGGIYVELSCSAACDQAAYADVSARGMPSFTDYAFAHLVQRNRRRLKVAFTGGQLQKLRAALRANRRITARLVGAVVDAGGDIESHTQKLTLRFNS